jgi:DNA-binding MarR family transcriptional regulator
MEDEATQAPSAPQVASGLVRLMLAMEALYTRESRKAGLTSQQAQLLCTAARRQAALGEIADVLRCDRSNVSRLLDRISARGLAYRRHADRDGRVAVVELTDDGKALVDRFEKNLEARLAALVAGWPSAQVDHAAGTLASLVGTIFADMDAEDQSAGRDAPIADLVADSRSNDKVTQGWHARG